MKLKATTRQFLVSAGAVALLMFIVLGRFMYQFWRATGSDPQSGRAVVLYDGLFFAGVVVLGLLIAWVRLLLDRRTRANRAPPLSLD